MCGHSTREAREWTPSSATLGVRSVKRASVRRTSPSATKSSLDPWKAVSLAGRLAGPETDPMQRLHNTSGASHRSRIPARRGAAAIFVAALLLGLIIPASPAQAQSSSDVVRFGFPFDEIVEVRNIEALTENS